MKHILLIVALAAACSAASMYMTVTPDSHLVIVNAARDTLWKSSDVVQFDSALVAGSAYSLVGGTIDQTARDTSIYAKWVAIRDSGYAFTALDTGKAAFRLAEKARDTARAALAGPDTVAARAWGNTIWLALAGKATDATKSDSALVSASTHALPDSNPTVTVLNATRGRFTDIFGALTGKSTTSGTADTTAGGSARATLAANATLFKGRDTTDFDDAKTLQTKDTTALFNAKTLQGKDTNAIHVYVGRDSAKVQKGDSLVGRVKTAFIQPPADSVQALQIFKADGTTSLLTVDSRNSRIGIKTTAPATGFDVNTTMYIRSYVSIFDGTTMSGYVGPGNALFVVGANAATDLGLRAIGKFAVSTGNATTPTFLIDAGRASICSVATRSTEKLFIKGNALISGHLTVDSTTKTGTFLVGDTVLIRTAGAAFAATKQFTTYADSCAGVDSIQLTTLNASGARTRVLTLRDSVFVKDGATVVKILGAAGKWCDVEYLGAPCSRWQVFGSN